MFQVFTTFDQATSTFLSIQEWANMQGTPRLNLIKYKSDVPNDDLIISPEYLTPQWCDSLVGLLPNVHQLVIHFSAAHELSHGPLLRLIELYGRDGGREGRGLKSLSISGNHNPDPKFEWDQEKLYRASVFI